LKANSFKGQNLRYINSFQRKSFQSNALYFCLITQSHVTEGHCNLAIEKGLNMLINFSIYHLPALYMSKCHQSNARKINSFALELRLVTHGNKCNGANSLEVF